jgi:hypothetical protein
LSHISDLSDDVVAMVGDRAWWRGDSNENLKVIKVIKAVEVIKVIKVVEVV